MLWAPSRIAFFTASGLVACAMTLKPRFRQISTAARIHLIGARNLVEEEVIGMEVHVQEAGHQVPALEIDHRSGATAARLSAWQDGADAAILDQHGTIRPYLGLDAVDQVRTRKDC